MKLIMLHIVFVILCTFLITCTKAQFSRDECCEEYCFVGDRDHPQVKRFSTKTPYHFARSEAKNYFFVPNCTPTKFWMLSRHGTRLPNANSIENLKDLQDLRDQVIDNYEVKRTKPPRNPMCQSDINLLHQWKWDNNITERYAEYLTEEGWKELRSLGNHFRNTFPDLITNIYTPDRFNFRYTNTQRTKASFMAFVEGIFGANSQSHIHVPDIPNEDLLLRPYDYCSAFTNNTQKKSNPDSEIAKFYESTIYKQLISDVSTRLGFKFTLDAKIIESIWDMCRYDQAWDLSKYSAWCTAFTPKQVEVLEFKEDLTYYYKSGYGLKESSDIPCFAINDMIKHLDLNQTANPDVVVYFSHSSMIHTFLVALGAFKDPFTLRANNYIDAIHRKWRTSLIGPFLSNVVAVKYDCPNENERQKAMIFVNEKPLDIDWCNVGLCDWKMVKEKYKHFQTDDCSKTFCGGTNSGNLMKTSIISIIALQLFYYILF